MLEWIKGILRSVYFFIYRLRGYPGLHIQYLGIREIKNEFGDVYSFVFRKEEPVVFEAGQYAHVIAPNAHLDNHHVRDMSIAAAPGEDRIVISMDLSSRSRFKEKFRAAKVGDRVGFYSVKGEFTRREDVKDKPIVFIAGGIGITAVRSHIVDLEDGDQAWSLIYAGRDYLYKDQWARYPNRVHLVKRKTLFSAIERTLSEKPSVYFVCGSGGFVADVSAFLRQNEISDKNIKAEGFGFRNV